MSKDFFQRLFVHPFKKWIIPVVLTLVFGTVVLLLKGFNLLIYYVDAFGIGGAVTFMIGCLMLLSHLGAFDTIVYGFSTFKGSKRKYHDLYDLTQEKNLVRSRAKWTFFPFIFVGFVFLVIGFVLNLFVGK